MSSRLIHAKTMSRQLTKLLLFLFATLLAGVAVAESFDEQLASIIVLQDKAVQRDIGITAQQRNSMNVYADAHRAKLSAYYKQINDAHGKVDEKKLEGMFWTLKRKVLAQLSAAQLKRLREISLQVLDFTALADIVVGKKVGLSADQESKVEAIVKAALEKAGGIRDGAVDKATAGYRNKNPKNQQ